MYTTFVVLEEFKRVDEEPELEFDWSRALNHTKEMMCEGVAIGPAGTFYVMGCQALLGRYERGERTKELYDEMIQLH